MGGFTFKGAERGAPPSQKKKIFFFVYFVSKYIIRNSQETSIELEYIKRVLRSLKVAPVTYRVNLSDVNIYIV